MKNFKRFISLLMSVVLLVTVMSACGAKEKVVWEDVEEEVPSYTEGDGEAATPSEDEAQSSQQTSSPNSSQGNTSGNGNTNTNTNATKGRFEGLNYKGKTIKLLVWYTPEPWEQKIYDDFAKMTGAKIKLVQQGNNANKLASLIANGDSPDAAMMGQSNFPSYITKKLVQPLDSFINKSKDTWLAYDLMDKVKYNNTYYALTDHFWGDSYWVYYNKDLFDANLEIKQDPTELYKAGKWTWDAFYDLASKMTKKDKQGNITQYGSIAAPLDSFILSAGALAVTPTNGTFKNTINTKQMKDAAAMDKKLRKDKYLVNDEGDFGSGNVAMYIYPQYAIRTPSKFWKSVKWDVVPFPTYTGGTHYNPAGYQFGVVPKGAKNAEAGFMLLNYRAYCQENLTTLTDTPKDWKEMYKKVCTGKTCAGLDVGILGSQAYGLYRDLIDPTQNTQTTIDSFSPKIDGAIKEFKEEEAAYK